MPPPPPDNSGCDNRWVAIDVAMAALGLSRRRTLELATAEHWRTRRPRKGDRTRQYLFTDIARTARNRKKTQDD